MVEFIFMLTKDDRTVENGEEVLKSVADTGCQYVGFSDVGLSRERLQELTKLAHQFGMQVMFEIMPPNREAELNSLLWARAAGVDWVLGGVQPTTGIAILGHTAIRYCPFPGRHPGVLRGEVSDIAHQAKNLVDIEGVHGVDLYAHRHTLADPEQLTRAVVDAVAGPVIVSGGGIVNQEQITMVAKAGAWGFAIGSDIFKCTLAGGPSVPDLVIRVLAMAEVASSSRSAQ